MILFFKALCLFQQLFKAADIHDDSWFKLTTVNMEQAAVIFKQHFSMYLSLSVNNK